MDKKLRGTLLIILGFCVVAIVALPLGATARRSPAIVQLNNLKQVAVGLKQYAIEHDGKFPPRLSDISPDYIEAKSIILEFRDPETRQPSDWIYYVGHTDKEPDDTPLAASPSFHTGRGLNYMAWRLITFIDTSTRLVTEDKFQRFLSRQPKPGISPFPAVPTSGSNSAPVAAPDP